MAVGIARQTGTLIKDEAYLKDRIQSCLSMRLGTHPMRRLKGSRIPELIDRPLNATTLFEIKVAVFDALAHPANGFADLTVTKVEIRAVEPGKVEISIVYSINGKLQQLSGIEVSR